MPDGGGIVIDDERGFACTGFGRRHIVDFERHAGDGLILGRDFHIGIFLVPNGNLATGSELERLGIDLAFLGSVDAVDEGAVFGRCAECHFACTAA